MKKEEHKRSWRKIVSGRRRRKKRRKRKNIKK